MRYQEIARIKRLEFESDIERIKRAVNHIYNEIFLVRIIFLQFTVSYGIQNQSVFVKITYRAFDASSGA